MARNIGLPATISQGSISCCWHVGLDLQLLCSVEAEIYKRLTIMVSASDLQARLMSHFKMDEGSRWQPPPTVIWKLCPSWPIPFACSVKVILSPSRDSWLKLIYVWLVNLPLASVCTLTDPVDGHMTYNECIFTLILSPESGWWNKISSFIYILKRQAGFHVNSFLLRLRSTISWGSISPDRPEITRF